MSETVDNDPAHTWDELSVDDVESADEISVREAGSNMLLVEMDDTIYPVRNTEKNRIMFNREKYSVNGRSLYTLLHSNQNKRVVLSKNPYVAIGPTQHEDSYRLWYGGPDKYMVKTPVSKVKKILQGIIDIVEHNNSTKIEEVYYYVLDNQVRREVVNKLLDPSLPADIRMPNDRIKVIPEGWLIDGMFLLNWEAEVYLYTEHWREGSFDPRSSNQYEEPGQFMEVTPSDSSVVEPREITFGDDSVRFGELEMMFLFRATWYLDWEHHLDDDAQVEVIKRTYNEYREIF